MYKYGIVSTASIVKRFIEGVRLAGDEVICIGSRDIDKAKEFAKNNKIKNYYGSYKEVYENKDVDIVYIPVINSMHYECAKEALLHNKHVVLEKPFTLYPWEAVDLFEIAKKKKLFLFEGVKNLFVPSTQFIKNNINKIGVVKKISTEQGVKNPFPENHWMYDASKGGGAFHGSSSYVFHYLKYIFEYPITKLKGSYKPSTNADMSCHFKFKLNKISVDSKINCGKELSSNCIIKGSKGKMIIHEFWRSHHVEIILKDGNLFEFKDSGNEFEYEAKHIQECLKRKLLESPIIKKEDIIEEAENIYYLYKKWDMV